MDEAAKALEEKRIDAALILTGWESPAVQRLARSPEIIVAVVQTRRCLCRHRAYLEQTDSCREAWRTSAA